MNKRDLLLKKNVVYVRRGKKVIVGTVIDRECLTVAVTKKVPLAQLKPEDRVPPVFEGMETDVIVDEMPQALRTGKHRPMPGGVSGGHPEVTAGTISPITINAVKYIISNNHVIANTNDASLGDQTWQPGRADGGQPIDTIGHLLRWVPIHFVDEESGCSVARSIVKYLNFVAKLFRRHTRLCTRSTKLNTVDAAVSRAVNNDDLADEILGIGVPAGFAQAHISEPCKKSGRTTHVTHGTVLENEGVAKVNFGAGRVALFEDQIITTNISSPGDSGSLVFNDNNEIIGMLFAGSSQITIVNKIQNVLEYLDMKGVTK